jgi:hypothetical protein
MLRAHEEIDRVVFESDLVRIGAFRCHPEHPSFQDTGPAQNYCFVFPRTAVEIQHEHEQEFVANPNVVTFYNAGQVYWRNPISPEGDRCDWFGVEPGLVRDTLRGFDSSVDDRPERLFQFSHGWSDAQTYLLQRRYSGKDGHLLRTYTCRIPGDTFGFDAVTMGDLDGSVVSAFLITSGWSGVHGHHSGRVFLISSGVTQPSP